VLFGLITWAAQPPDRASITPLYWTAAIYGLSLTHHRSMLLLFPAIGVYLWLNSRMRSEPGWTTCFTAPAIARLLALVLLPLLIYLVIPLRAPHAPYAALRIGPEHILQLYTPTLGGFIEHVSGQVFGSALGASADLGIG